MIQELIDDAVSAHAIVAQRLDGLAADPSAAVAARLAELRTALSGVPDRHEDDPLTSPYDAMRAELAEIEADGGAAYLIYLRAGLEVRATKLAATIASLEGQL